MQDYQERRAIRTELKGLAKEERQRQERAVKEVLGRAAVVCSTLSGIGVRLLHGATFDVAVIDEAAQVRLHSLKAFQHHCSQDCLAPHGTLG